MAVVRFSDELKTLIIDNAKLLFNGRLNKLTDNPPDFADEVANIVMAPYLEHINALPSGFFSTTEKLEINKIGSTHYGVSKKLSRKIPVPRERIRRPDGVAFDAGYNGISVNLPDTPEFKHIKIKFDEWREEIDALEKQRDEFVAGVKKIINAHATLAPALKAWPPLWDLVPESTKERHRKVVERVKTETVEVDVDLTKLTSTVVAAKFIK